ncbi:MAG: sugar O-acetyltransferase [Clostridia bacterium]
MDINTIKSRMVNGKMYCPSDPILVNEQAHSMDCLIEYNNLKYTENVKGQDLLKKMFAVIGDECLILQPFYASWGGKNVHFGNNIFANFNLTLIDDGDIFVGDNVMMASNVTLVTATHPINPTLRKTQTQYNKPIYIGENVWLGANVVVLPGVSIGKNSVIGAGSVVTKDIPENVVAVGAPCKVLRLISEKDDIYYDHDKIIDIPIIK